MNSSLLKNAFGWGFLLWFIGYGLGFIAFAFVPPSIIGWVIMPIGIALTLLILFTRMHGTTAGYFVGIGIIWTLIAVVSDYIFLVQMLQPADGYYKLDVYLYYALTFALPVVVGWWKTSHRGLTVTPTA